MGNFQMLTDALSYRSLFWNNLMLLGFDPKAQDETVHIHQDVFVGNAGAGRAMEVITHFLFNLLDSRLAQERFAACWPVIDRSQSREYRNAVVKWLESLKKEGHLPLDVVVRRSYFEECRGARFEQVLLALSNHVMTVVLTRQYGCEPYRFSSSDNRRSVAARQLYIDALKLRTVAATEAFVAEVAQRSRLQNEWKNYGQRLADAFDDTVNHMDTLQDVCYRYEEEITSSYKRPVSLEQCAGDREQRLERARKHWATISEYLLEQQRNLDMVDIILDGEANQYSLDFKSRELEIPNEITRVMQQEPGLKQLQLYCNGDLDMVALTKLWRVAQTKLIQTIQTHAEHQEHQEPKRDASSVGIGAFVEGQINEHDALLHRIHHLSESLDAELKIIQQSVAARKRSYFSNGKLDNFGDSLNVAVPHVQASPVRRHVSLHTRVTTPHCPKPVLFESVSTPEALSSLSRTIRQQVQLEVDGDDEAFAETKHQALRDRLRELAPKGRQPVASQNKSKPSTKPITTTTPSRSAAARLMTSKSPSATAARQASESLSEGRHSETTPENVPPKAPESLKPAALNESGLPSSHSNRSAGHKAKAGSSIASKSSVTASGPSSPASPRRTAMLSSEALLHRTTPPKTPSKLRGHSPRAHSATRRLLQAGVYDKLCEQILALMADDESAQDVTEALSHLHPPASSPGRRQSRGVSSNKISDDDDEDDPISALDQRAFQARKEIPRTPEKPHSSHKPTKESQKPATQSSPSEMLQATPSPLSSSSPSAAVSITAISNPKSLFGNPLSRFEQFKPKTPSRLRAVVSYEDLGSPNSSTSDDTSTHQVSSADVSVQLVDSESNSSGRTRPLPSSTPFETSMQLLDENSSHTYFDQSMHVLEASPLQMLQSTPMRAIKNVDKFDEASPQLLDVDELESPGTPSKRSRMFGDQGHRQGYTGCLESGNWSGHPKHRTRLLDLADDSDTSVESFQLIDPDEHNSSRTGSQFLENPFTTNMDLSGDELFEEGMSDVLLDFDSQSIVMNNTSSPFSERVKV
ncbi:hypothetical protein HDU85_001202 [Gaertneriomyces sp. JEL0708]|nr:hypothetical protein HDU85_001202 [Gaertneriomyces sp. JEL0708]